MLVQRINQLFPFLRLLKLLAVFSLVIQTIIILYNNFSGYYTVPDFSNFLHRLFYSTALSIIAGLLIAYPNLLIIYLLNKKFPWGKHAIKRIGLQFVLTLLLASLVAVFITVFAHVLDAYEEGLQVVLVNNILIVCVINIILMILLEAFIFFNDSRLSQHKADVLEKELSQIKFEVLKNQINPHFMFNSLNVLSGLIESDTEKAQQFIDEFSSIYRYVLETIEKQVVSLNEEIGFIRSYIILQQIRYGHDLEINMNIPAEILDFLLPPLSLQTVLENAIKHNIINEKHKLKIEIYYNEQSIIARNNIQSKISKAYSSGLGQKNMMKRYAMLTESLPEFIVEAGHYMVKIPLIKSE